MSEQHRIRCDARLEGPLAGWCPFNADHRFQPAHPDADKSFTVDACGGHAARYRDETHQGTPVWEEIPLPKITCDADARKIETLRKLLRDALPFVKDEADMLREKGIRFAPRTASYRKWLKRGEEVERFAARIEAALNQEESSS